MGEGRGRVNEWMESNQSNFFSADVTTMVGHVTLGINGPEITKKKKVEVAMKLEKKTIIIIRNNSQKSIPN